MPEVECHKFHRYDLIRALMVSPDQDAPVQPLAQHTAKTLKVGRRVRVAGRLPLPKTGQDLPALSPAPDPRFGWRDEIYCAVWTSRLAVHLYSSADRAEVVPLGVQGPANPYETFPLSRFEGYKGS